MLKQIALAALAAAALAGCNREGPDQDRPPVSRNFAVGGFERLEVAGPYQVEVRTGAKTAVTASGPERMMKRLLVEVRDGRLLIRSKSDKKWFSFGSRHHGEVRVTVTVPQLRAAAITGSGGVHIDRVTGDGFAGSIAGSGEIALQQIEVKELRLAITGSGSMNAARGRATHLVASIAGSGEIDTSALAAETAELSISGSGRIGAQASKTAAVEVMGSGEVDVRGGAKCTISKGGSGDVRCS